METMFKLTFTGENYTNLIGSRGNNTVYEILQMHGATYTDPVMSNEHPFNKIVEEAYLTFDSEDNMLLFALKYL